MKKNSFIKSAVLLIFLLLTSVSAISGSMPDIRDYTYEPALPIPFPICDPERLLDPDPVSWKIGIIKITPEMREHFVRLLAEEGPDPQPWMESDYCTVIY